MDTVHTWFSDLGLPVLLIVGVMSLLAFWVGKSVRVLKLPSIIGFMVAGVILGPSVLGVISEPVQERLGFLTQIALGFVAVSIGIELSFRNLKRLGGSIVWIILGESLLAFAGVTGGVYLLTRDLPLALIFGSIAPASAPAGTVAVIREYKARGSLTEALYAVVGFDDGLGIIIFAFASAIAASLLGTSAGGSAGFWAMVRPPLVEIGLSLGVGLFAGLMFTLITSRLRTPADLFLVLIPFVLIIIGLTSMIDLSFILANMTMGIFVVNRCKPEVVRGIHEQVSNVMPFLFVLFFVLAGANLHLSALASLGLVGGVYVVCRSGSKLLGAWLGAVIGRAEKKIRRYLGLGILSQAGVAIGLSLIVKEQFAPLGDVGARIGAAVITTVAATSIIFEIVGPICARIALRAAGEIPEHRRK